MVFKKLKGKTKPDNLILIPGIHTHAHTPERWLIAVIPEFLRAIRSRGIA